MSDLTYDERLASCSSFLCGWAGNMRPARLGVNQEYCSCFLSLRLHQVSPEKLYFEHDRYRFFLYVQQFEHQTFFFLSGAFPLPFFLHHILPGLCQRISYSHSHWAMFICLNQFSLKLHPRS